MSIGVPVRPMLCDTGHRNKPGLASSILDAVRHHDISAVRGARSAWVTWVQLANLARAQVDKSASVSLLPEVRPARYDSQDRSGSRPALP